MPMLDGVLDHGKATDDRGSVRHGLRPLMRPTVPLWLAE
jgi:hypothetical protein